MTGFRAGEYVRNDHFILRTCLAALVATALSGCGGLGIGLGIGLLEQRHRWVEEACADLAAQGVHVEEAQDLTIPRDEGKVDTFAPAQWNVEGRLNGTFEPTRPALPKAGMLVLTEASVLFLPSVEGNGVRIPLPVVLDTPHRFDLMGAPRALVVESCGGRLDVFILGQPSEPTAADPTAIATAADQLDAHYAATMNRATLFPWERVGTRNR